MNVDDIFQVIVQRKTQAGQIKLNFAHKGAAEKAFDRLIEMTDIKIGGVPGKREIFEDYFGAKVAFDPPDIGNIVFVQLTGDLRERASEGMLTAKEQAKFQMEAQKSPLLNGALQAPPSGMLRA